MATGPKVDRKAIVYRGIESEELDYKAAQNWRDLARHEKAKFVRHCLALANTKGGYVVIGVGEDRAGKPALFTGLTDEQIKSFDPTDVGSFINHRVDPPIDFEIVRPKVDGKHYAIFVVRRFRHLPHVCTQSSENELQQGCFYIRTKDAASRVAYRASEIHDLVQRSLRNQREVLGRMLRGLLYEKGHRPEPLAESLFNEQLRHATEFISRNGRAFTKCSCFEIDCRPSEFHETAFNLQEIRSAVEDSLITFHDEPLMDIGDAEETYYTNLSLRSLVLERRRYFQAFRSGLFHYLGGLTVSDGAIKGDELLHFVAGSIFFLGNYYNHLGYDDELMSLTFRMTRVDGVRLEIEGRRKSSKASSISRIPEILIELKRSAADLFAGVSEHATRVLKEICLRFNLGEGLQTKIKEMTLEYLSRR